MGVLRLSGCSLALFHSRDAFMVLHSGLLEGSGSYGGAHISNQ